MRAEVYTIFAKVQFARDLENKMYGIACEICERKNEKSERECEIYKKTY